MAERDRISELPADILDNILGFLSIQEVARTTILSSIWKDIWFSPDFFDYICLKYPYAGGGRLESPIFEVINKILIQHNGPIQKIIFCFCGDVSVILYPISLKNLIEYIANLMSDNLNQWFLLLTQNGVEEIDISCSIDIETRWRVPNCIFSCPTLKRLKLFNVSVELMNASLVLPNVTSLCLDLVNFKPRNCSDYVVYLPMLEDLSFVECTFIFHFNIVAPKLGSLKIILAKFFCFYYKGFGVLPPNLDLRTISSLNLDCSTCCFEMFMEELTRVGNAPTLNIELLKLHISSYSFLPKNINNSAFIHLLQACPKLCELDIWGLQYLKLNPEDFVLMEELSSVARTLKMLRTLKFSHFNGWRPEMQSIKVLLAFFLGIKKVVIVRGWIRSHEEFKIMQELLRFPRASKAEFFYIK